MHTSINSLGADLTDMVVEHIAREDSVWRGWTRNLASYATVSRLFRYAVERRTFRSINISASKFHNVPIITPDRAYAVRTVRFELHLPGDEEFVPADKKQTIVLSEDDPMMLKRNAVFTEGVRNLLKYLGSTEMQHAPPISVHLDVTSPRPSWRNELRFLLRDLCTDAREIAYAKAHVRLGDIQELPVLSRVVSFKVSEHSFIEGESLVRIASKFPHLEILTLTELSDRTSVYASEREDRRSRFAKALKDHSFPYLKTFELSYYTRRPNNQLCDFSSAVPSRSPPLDHLSQAIHHFSQRLTVMRLDVPTTIASSLFWPPSGQKPHWPFLRIMRVYFSILTPEGYWRYGRLSNKSSNLVKAYLLDPDVVQLPDEHDNYHWSQAVIFARDAGTYPHNEFRCCPIAERVYPMFIAAARATSEMPRLEMMRISSEKGFGRNNEMIFVKRGMNLTEIEPDVWTPYGFPKFGVEDKPTVYWLYDAFLRFDPVEVNNVWRELRGGEESLKITE